MVKVRLNSFVSRVAKLCTPSCVLLLPSYALPSVGVGRGGEGRDEGGRQGGREGGREGGRREERGKRRRVEGKEEREQSKMCDNHK